MKPSYEIQLAAAVAVAEAGGEANNRAIPAVIEVMRNRAEKHKTSLLAVVLKPMQFSCLNGVHDIPAFVARYQQHPRYQDALNCLTVVETDYAKGADHYCRVDCFPAWANGVEPTAIIGQHKFFTVP